MNERKQSTAMSEEERFAEKAKELFDQSVQELDANTLSRLNRSRQAALAELEQGARPGISLGLWQWSFLWIRQPQMLQVLEEVQSYRQLLLEEEILQVQGEVWVSRLTSSLRQISPASVRGDLFAGCRCPNRPRFRWVRISKLISPRWVSS